MLNAIKLTKSELGLDNMSYIYKLQDWIDIQKINWYFLSHNPNAIHLLEQNMEKIDWYYLSLNPNAIHILEQNMDKIGWYFNLSRNPNIFVYDYNKMKLNRITNKMTEELIARVFHPQRLLYICKKYKIKFDQLMEIY